MIESFFEWLFGKEKTPEQIKQEIEESNEDNYRQHKIIVLRESREFKKKYKEIIEDRLKKDISKVSLRELYQLGFNSEHITKKHLEEIIE